MNPCRRVSLLLCFSLLPAAHLQSREDRRGIKCTFPFVFHEKMYYTCTTVFSIINRPWCATTSDYDKDREWRYCPDTEYGGEYDGIKCTFPFVFRGKMYYTCTTAFSVIKKPWCATTGNYDKDQQWKYCPDTNISHCVFPFKYNGYLYKSCATSYMSGDLWCATTHNYDKDHQWKWCTTQDHKGISRRKNCTFPFVFRGKMYYTCTTAFSIIKKPWCATTGNYDKDREWRYCPADTSELISISWRTVVTAGGLRLVPGDISPCVFPFKYNGNFYKSCIEDYIDSGRLWCATTHNYDKDRQRKWCTTQEYGGNSDGKNCTFPFLYRGMTYYTCTAKIFTDEQPWCATTGSYDKDWKWSYCADTRVSSDPMGSCVFPFIFKGKSRTTCVTDGSLEGKPWCSLAKNYDVQPEKVACETSDSSHCTFPFIYKEKAFCSCTSEGSADEQLWCATTSSYDKDGKWKTCVLKEYGGNTKTKGCVFPFTYKDKKHYNCTRMDEPSGRPWCATTPSYDEDGESAFCGDAEPGRNPKGTCKFPFVYKDDTYSSCTVVGSFWRKAWCSLTWNYDMNHEWKYCEKSDLEKQCSEQL